MRALGLAISAFIAGCSFGSPASGTPGKDAAVDGPVDAPPIDTPPITAFRKRITIDPAKVTDNQTAFPVWIVLAADNDLKARATASGADIHFKRPDGTPLAYQIQRWDKATGRLEAWVRADLDDTADTVIELRYGETAAAHAPDAPAVFSSSFLAVWHLDDSLSNTTVADATNKKPGTAAGGLGTSDQVAAQIGGGIDFDGSGNQITFTNPFTGTTGSGDHTISAWVNQRTASGCDTIVTMGDSKAGDSRWFHSHYDISNSISVGFYSSSYDWPTGTNPLPKIENTGWVLLHWVFNASTRESRIYRNGVQVGTPHTFGTGIATKTTNGWLGYAPMLWGTCALNGILDEVRLSSAERSAGWIATEFANQSSPQTFYTVGAEAPLP